MAALFEPLTIKDVTFRNRIIVSPMCQYSAVDGVPNEWHHVHLGSMAIGGDGLVYAEATAVTPEGRISPGDTGIYNETQVDAWRPISKFIKAQGAVPGIQIAHAGRKASANKPWEGDDALEPNEGAWPIMGPSAFSFGGQLTVTPKEMTKEDIAQVKQNFVDAARHAREAGFEVLQLHFAHGYLASSFWSPIANKRTDEYGGNLENRARFMLETLRAVRAVWPEKFPLTARVSVDDFLPGGITLDESIELIRWMKAEGLEMLDASVGMNSPDISGIPWGPGMMLPMAARIRKEVGIPTTTSWMITDPHMAEKAIAEGQADAVTLARELLRDPHWPYRAAKELGVETPQSVLSIQYGHWLKR